MSRAVVLLALGSCTVTSIGTRKGEPPISHVPYVGFFSRLKCSFLGGFDVVLLRMFLVSRHRLPRLVSSDVLLGRARDSSLNHVLPSAEWDNLCPAYIETDKD